MAQPIPFDLPQRNAREELQARLERAPAEHAEAVLALYEVVQGLHDRGVLDLLRGALGARDTLVEKVVEATRTPESIRAIRNFLILAKTLGAMEPELLKSFAEAVPEALAQAKAQAAEPPGLWAMLNKFRNKNLRRGLVAVNSLLEAFGRNLSSRAGEGSASGNLR